MDVRFTPEQQQLRTSAREFLERECPLARTREWFEAGRPFPASLWKQMAALGWLGLPFAEADGGADLGALELGLIQEQLGRQLVPAPYYASVVLAGAAVALSDDAEEVSGVVDRVTVDVDENDPSSRILRVHVYSITINTIILSH